MEIKKYLMYLIIAACLLVLIPPIQAVSDENSDRVIYQTSFTSDPRWDTNNPSTNYWDPNTGMYHFSLEPSTGGYAYTVIDYDRGSFSLDYDMILNRIDDGATFRFGMAGSEMDPSKAPNVLTMFTNNQAKYGQIMVLHLVTPGSKLIEVSSQTSSDPRAYNGPTAKYEINTTYHVAVNYDDNQKTLSMNVNEKKTGKEIWSVLYQHCRKPERNEEVIPWFEGGLRQDGHLCTGIYRQYPAYCTCCGNPHYIRGKPGQYPSRQSRLLNPQCNKQLLC